MKTFLKDPFLMEEDHKKEDLLDFSDEVDRLKSRIVNIEQSSIVGYIGKFGSGKSTTIYQVQKELEILDEVKWFDFDAWKYPERRDLWEGFVLDIADQMGQRSRKKDKISADGKLQKGVGVLHSIADAVGKFEPTSKVGASILNLFRGAPIERVYELQELFKKMLRGLKQTKIYIVVEDIDRSGDAGKFFLETLRQFIKNNLVDKQVVVIVPIGSEVYEDNLEHRASFLKVIDYPIYFEPRNVGYSKFVEAAFLEDSFPAQQASHGYSPSPSKWKEHLEDFFMLAHSSNLTIRDIKSLIRSADSAFGLLRSKGYEPDPRVLLALELLNNIPSEENRRWSQTLDFNKKIEQKCPIWKFLHAVAVNDRLKKIGDHWKTYDIAFVDNDTFTIPVFNSYAFRDDEQCYRLSGFYLIPFGLQLK